MDPLMQAFAAVSGSGSASLVLLLTELTGLYAISTVLLIRKQLPLKYRCTYLTSHLNPPLLQGCLA